MQKIRPESKSLTGNILLLVTQLEPAGAQTAIANLANLLTEKGYEVTLCFFFVKIPCDLGLSDRVKQKTLVGESSFLGKAFLGFLNLLKLLRAEKPECFITFTHYANLLGSLAGRLTKTPTIICHRNEYQVLPTLARIVDPVLYRLGLYKYVTFNSNAVLDSFKNVYPPHPDVCKKVIHNAISTPLEHSHIEELREFPDERFCLSVGRLTRIKNQDVLIAGFAAATFKGKLVIVGTGPEEDRLRELSKTLNVDHRVIFLGNLPRANVISLMEKSDYFLMPSTSEGMSNALLEAIYAAATTVVLATPSQIEVVKVDESYYGLVLESGTIAEWSKAISGGMTVSGDQKELRRSILGRFSKENHEKNFLDIIEASRQAYS